MKFFTFFLAALFACGSPTPFNVNTVARRDLACHEQISIYNPGRHHELHASGCGRKGVYVLDGDAWVLKYPVMTLGQK